MTRVLGGADARDGIRKDRTWDGVLLNALERLLIKIDQHNLLRRRGQTGMVDGKVVGPAVEIPERRQPTHEQRQRGG